MHTYIYAAKLHFLVTADSNTAQVTNTAQMKLLVLSQKVGDKCHRNQCSELLQRYSREI